MVKQKKQLIKISLYFDSSTLIDSIHFREGNTKVNKKRKFDIGKINPQKAEILISKLNIIEVSEHLKDSMISKMAINDGYSYFDLCKDRIDEIELSEKNLGEINTRISNEMINLPAVVSSHLPDFSSVEMEGLMDICNKYRIFLIDAMHFFIADKTGCNVFVTSDKTLKKNLTKLLKESMLSEEIKILTSKEFKNSLLKKITS